MDFVTAVGEATGLAEAHRVQWLSPRERAMLVAEASARVLAVRPRRLADLSPAVPSLMGVVRKWQRDETQAAREEVIPAIMRVAQATAAVSLLGRDELTTTAQEVADAANDLIGAMASRPRTRRAAQERFEQTVCIFGQHAGLAIEEEYPSRLERVLHRRRNGR
jgi:hypothetical protein